MEDHVVSAMLSLRTLRVLQPPWNTKVPSLMVVLSDLIYHRIIDKEEVVVEAEVVVSAVVGAVASAVAEVVAMVGVVASVVVEAVALVVAEAVASVVAEAVASAVAEVAVGVVASEVDLLAALSPLTKARCNRMQALK